MSLPIGATRLTADGVVGVSGKKIRVYGIIVHSGGTGAVVTLHNGTSGSGDEYDEINGTANVSKRISYPGGLLFSAGCFYNEDANTTYSTIIYEQENS